MKKIDLSITKQNNIDVIRYDFTPTDIYDDKVSDKVSQVANIVPFQYSESEGKKSVTSYVNETTTLASMFKQIMDKKQVLCVLNGLISAFEIGTQGVPVSYIVKDFNYIYVNPESYSVKCIVVPVKQEVMPITEIAAFFREFMANIRYSDEDNDNYVAKIITLINSDDFSNSKLKNLVDDYLEKLNLFISKDKGLTLMPDVTNAGTDNNNVKVNKVNVMNNMANPQMQFGGGQPGMPMFGMPMSGMPMAPQPVQPMAPQPVQPMAPQPVQPMAPQPVQPMAPQPVQPMAPQPVQPVAPQPVQPVMEQSNPVAQEDNKPKPVLVYRKTGELINISKHEFAIGKSQANADYVILDNPVVSRIHCYIIQRNGVNYIKDNNSTNHTYVNGVQLQPEEEVLLKNKTIIRIADEEFTFVLRKGE